jgi:cell division septal protein FtsQ
MPGVRPTHPKGLVMLKRTTVLAILSLAALPVLSQAQAPPELREAMRARLEAVWKKDAAAWDRLTADEFTVIVPEGRLMSKAERLAVLKAEKPEPPHVIEREQIRVYGETAVRRFVDGSEWVLEVWVRKNGAWRVVAAQVNVAKP